MGFGGLVALPTQPKMAVEITTNAILKPFPTSPSSPHNNAVVPLTIFDKAAFDLHVAVLYAYRSPMPLNEAMKEGLAKALNIFPHLAGRLGTDDQGRQCIHLNGAGIRLIEADVPVTLAERLPLDPSPELINFRPPIDGVKELFQIQLNRFACGGLIIGQTAHHRVCDGQSMSAFFVTWARLVRGLDVGPLPYHDRQSIAIPRNPPICEFNHREIEFKGPDNLDPSSDTSANIVSLSSIDNLLVTFPSNFITQLKSNVAKDCPGQRFSTFECLLTHLWKKVTYARGLAGDDTTQVRVAVNGRARMRPAVPMEYFGNLVLWAYPKLKVKELVDMKYGDVAKAIHDAVANIDERYFQSFVDFGEMTKDGHEEDQSLEATAAEVGQSLSPNIEVDSWLKFQFHELDFGGGGPCAFLPPNMPVEGLLIMVPSSKEIGGVDVYMTLFPECVPKFKQVSHTLS